jgi:hypothetical protein
MKMQILAIRHYGLPFRNSAHAMLLYSGPIHHYVLLLR